MKQPFKELTVRLSRQISFLVAAGVLAGGVLGTIIYLTVFLGSNLSSVFTVGEKPSVGTQFDIAAYEKLQLPK